MKNPRVKLHSVYERARNLHGFGFALYFLVKACGWTREQCNDYLQRQHNMVHVKGVRVPPKDARIRLSDALIVLNNISREMYYDEFPRYMFIGLVQTLTSWSSTEVNKFLEEFYLKCLR